MEADELEPPLPPPPPPQPIIEEDEGERMCRYCFDGEEYGERLSPCACAGGQKWVHLECLRKWQKEVVLTQPTHPKYHTDIDKERAVNKG